jgi:PAS domain S-box-containing protein
LRYAVAVLAVGLALLLRHALNDPNRALPPYVAFYPAVMLTACLAGFGPGMVATVLATILAAFLYFPPSYHLAPSAADSIGLGIFASMGALMSVVAGLHYQAHQREAEYEKELAVRASEKRYRDLVELSPDAVFVSRNSRIVFVNPAAVALFGAARAEQVLGKSSYEFFHPDDHAAIRERAARLLAGHRVPLVEGTVIRLDGTLRSAEIAACPFVDQEGVAIQVVLRDVTDRKQAEASLRESEQRFRDISEAAGEFIWEVDTQGLFTYVNRASLTLLGYAEAELVGKLHFYDLHPEEGREEFRAVALGFFARESPFVDYYNQMVSKDGRVLELLTNGVPVIDRDGRTVGYRGSDRDVTEQRRAQKAMMEEASRRRVLFEQSHDGIVVLDGNGKVYEANQRYADMLGYSMEEIQRLYVWDWDLQWTRDQLLEKVRLLDERGDYFETRHRRKDGTWYDVEISTSGTIWSGQKYVFCVCRDVSARKAAEVALRRSEERLKMALAASRLCVWEADLKRGSVEVVLEYMGIAGAEAFPGTIQGAVELLHPDDAPRFLAAMQKAAVERGAIGCEYRIYAPDGQIHWLSTLGQYEFDEIGEAHRVVGTAQDITLRKRAEDELRASEERYRCLVELSPEAIYIHRDSRIEFVNPAAVRLFGAATPDDLIGKTPFDIFHPDCHREIRERIETQLQDSRPTRFLEQKIVRLDGTVVDVEATSAPFDDASGRAIQVMVHDITRRKQIELEMRRAMAAAEAASQAKSQFLANMSHEIRTPMTSILGFTELLMRGEVAENDRCSFLQIVQRNGQCLLQLINDILDLSKIEAGNIRIEPASCSPVILVEEVVALMRLRAEEKNLTLEAHCLYPLPATIRTDAVRVRQVLVNLVGNAVKFTQRGGVQVSVSFSPVPTPRIHFTVTDTGIGISTEGLAKLFHPFTQVDASLTRQQGGSGLGLAISQRLAEMLGGSIDVRSQPGFGSTFTLSIDAGPLDSVEMLHAPPHPTPQTIAPHAVATLQGRVLLVEDSVDSQELLKFVLTGLGLSVDVADTGREALTMIAASAADCRLYDLILLDIQMPGMSGYETATKLRSIGWNRPIVALTAHAMVGDREKCLAAGCDDYLPKPVSHSVLVAAIQRHLGGK